MEPTLSGSAGVENESGANYGHGKEAYKSDKAQRQSDGLEKKLERRPAQVPKKKAA
jgi:hypothetical protein